MKPKHTISVIVLTRNEENIVENNIKKIYDFLSSLDFFKNFEILVCDYSDDNTPTILKHISEKYSKIRFIPVKKRGIGIGLKTGIKKVNYEIIIFYPIDLSWDLQVIVDSFRMILNNVDIVLGSRECKGSIVKRRLKRRIFSKLYNLLINFLFDLHIKDTQCTMMFKKSDIDYFIDKIPSDNAFFQTEFLIYAKKNNLKIIEIPVFVKDYRKSRNIKPIRYGFLMLRQIIKRFKEFRLNIRFF